MKKKLALLCLLSLLPFNALAAPKINKATLVNMVGKKIVVAVGTWPKERGWKLYRGNNVGAVVSTGYTAKLTNSITAISSTIYVSSVKDINGITLPLTAIQRGYFNIEPGGARQEPIMCTGVTINALTGCTRGLLATGISETGSSTLAFSHNAGATVIMTNIAQFYNNFMDLNSDQSTDGVKTFVNLPLIPTTTPTDPAQAVSFYQFSQATTTGGVNASETAKGVGELATGAEAASSTLTGSTGARLIVPTSITTSTAGIANTIPTTNNTGRISSGFYQGNDNTWSGSNAFAGTTTANGIANGFTKFGGNGSDGILNITSGTTTLNLASSSYFIKNYSSISIATGSELTFSNPAASGTIIILKVSGDADISGLINLAGKGASTSAIGYGTFLNSNTNAGAAIDLPNNIYRKIISVTNGAGGVTGGGTQSAGSGRGGFGGGSLIIECKGNWIFRASGTISVAGANGVNGLDSVGSGSGGGGGGGAGGSVVVVYNTLVADSGIYNIYGGNGGKGGNGSGSGGVVGSSGGNAGSNPYVGGIGGIGRAATAGNGGSGTNGGGPYGGTGGGGGTDSTSSGPSGGGGGGATGFHITVPNTEF